MANLKTFADAKDWVMLNTRDYLALLASDLGYAWPMGTKGQFPGDNMLLHGEEWVSDMTGKKTGPKPEERLVIKYGDWKLAVQDVRYEHSTTSELEPYSAKSGRIFNDDPHEVTKTIKEDEVVVREIINVNETGFSAGASVGASFTYEPPAGVGASVKYKVSAQQGTTTTDTTGNKNSTTLSVDTSKPVDPYSAVQWNMMISKKKATSKYKAKVFVSFSVEFQGYLRWGGAKGLYKNFHKDYSGSDSRPTVNYKFGSATKSFADDLKEQSSQNKSPWLWSEMKKRYAHSDDTINHLSDVNTYKFDIAGRIEDVEGREAFVKYKELPFMSTEIEA